MLKRNKKILSVVASSVILGIALLSPLKPETVYAASTRLYGQDRYETAVEVSKSGWQTSDYVVVASGEDYPDALCAAPLAKKYNAPILLTGSKELNDKTKAEISRLKAKHVFIIGKYGSVSESGENELKSIPGVEEIKRLGGNSRYETSVMIAKELGTVSKVVITSGRGFADAISVAPIAAAENMPILLTEKDNLPEEVQEYLNDNKQNITETYIVGGEGAVSNETANKASSNSVRLGGQDRFDTNVKVMQYFSKELKFDNIYVVQGDGPTGKEFADALTGTALAVKSLSPVVLTYKTLPANTESFIKTVVTKTSKVTALGGDSVVPETLISEMENLASGTDNTQTPVQTGTSAGGGGGASTGTSQQATDGDIELIFSAGQPVTFNINNEDTVDITNNIKSSNFTKIRVYSSNSATLYLYLLGQQSSKPVNAGWTEFAVPADFGITDGGTPGVSKGSLELVGSNGQVDLTVVLGKINKTIKIKYE